MIKVLRLTCLLCLMVLAAIVPQSLLTGQCPNAGPASNVSCTTNMPFPMVFNDICVNQTQNNCSGNWLHATFSDLAPNGVATCQKVGFGPPQQSAQSPCYTYYACTWNQQRMECRSAFTIVSQYMPLYYRCTDPDCVRYWADKDAEDVPDPD